MRSRASARLARLVAITAALPFCGCLLGPNYTRPPTPEPDTWQTPLGGGLTSAEVDRKALATWWTVLEDPLLSELVSRAVESNLDVQAARERVQEAREHRKLAAAGLLPTIRGRVTLSPTSTHSKTPATGLEALWNLDLFGKIRRGVEGAQGDQQARREDLHDALVNVAAEVVQSYVDLRTLQAHLAIADANLSAQGEAAQLADWRAQAGLTTSLDVLRASADLEQARAQLPSLHAGVEEAENRLALLLGQTPGALRDRLEATQPIPAAPAEVAVGVPADALLRRPDVRRAERQLAAETARVGAAEAQAYPSLSLTGAIGAGTISFVSPPGFAAAAAAQASEVLFDHGAIRATIRGQKAVRAEARDHFESVVLTALDDVENAIVEYEQEQTRQRGLAQASASAASAATLSRERYAAGLVDFQVVLDADRSLYAIEEQHVASQARVITDLVHLYQSLGGGWSAET